jgi:hypothetical protein
MNITRCEQCGLINWQVEEKCQHCGLSLPQEQSFDLAANDSGVPAKPGIVEHPQLSAGLWFAGAGSIPALLFVMTAGGSRSLSTAAFPLFVLLPAFVAGVCGACFGSSILDPSRVQTPAQAAGRGFIVAAASFLFYILLISVVASGGVAFFFLLFYGSIIIGWLVAIVGALAGWLLYKRREGFNQAS